MPRKPLAPAAAGARFTTKRRAYGGGLEGSRANAGGWPKPDQQGRKPKPSPGMDAGGKCAWKALISSPYNDRRPLSTEQ